VGERISHAEADRRYDDDTMKRHHTFLFTLNNRTVIDAAVGGNESRFINHSCAPNCEAVIDSGHIYIESIRTIQPGAELVYDYQYERAPDADESDEARYPCRCGAPNCRGTILAPPKRKRAAAGAKRSNGASKRKKTASKKRAGSKKKGAASKRKSTAAKRAKTTSQRSAPATRGGTLTRKLGKTSSTRAKKSAPAAKKPSRGRKTSANPLKAAAKRRRSA
jgi:hypothetical protein